MRIKWKRNGMRIGDIQAAGLHVFDPGRPTHDRRHRPDDRRHQRRRRDDQVLHRLGNRPERLFPLHLQASGWFGHQHRHVWHWRDVEPLADACDVVERGRTFRQDPATSLEPASKVWRILRQMRLQNGPQNCRIKLIKIKSVHRSAFKNSVLPDWRRVWTSSASLHDRPHLFNPSIAISQNRERQIVRFAGVFPEWRVPLFSLSNFIDYREGKLSRRAEILEHGLQKIRWNGRIEIRFRSVPASGKFRVQRLDRVDVQRWEGCRDFRVDRSGWKKVI